MSLRLRVLPSLLAVALASPAADPIPLPRFAAAPRALSWQDRQPAAAGQRYKLTIVEDASTFRRAARGRASSEAVVRVTDENDRPVAGIVVTFSMPQLTGASFTNGALTVTSTTSPTGLASAGLNVSTSATTDFSISVTASVPGEALTASIPVSVAGLAAVASAAGGGGGGLSGGTLAVILAAVGGGAAAGIYAATRNGNDPRPNPTPNPGTPQPPAGIRIGIGGGVSVIPGQ